MFHRGSLCKLETLNDPNDITNLQRSKPDRVKKHNIYESMGVYGCPLHSEKLGPLKFIFS